MLRFVTILNHLFKITDRSANQIEQVCFVCESRSGNNFFVLNASPAGGVFTGKGVENDTLFISAYTNPGDSIFVSYKYTDTKGCSYIKMDTALLAICEDVKPVNPNDQVTLFPNPSPGSFRLSYYAAINCPATIKITDELGEVVFTEEKNLASGDNKLSFDISNQTDGLYLVQITTPGETTTTKLLIRR